MKQIGRRGQRAKKGPRRRPCRLPDDRVVGQEDVLVVKRGRKVVGRMRSVGTDSTRVLGQQSIGIQLTPSPVHPGPLKIGIISVADGRKGLWRDTQILHWLVSAGSVRSAGHEAVPSVFCVSNLGAVARGELDVTAVAPPENIAGAVKRVQLKDWLETIDVLVFCEVLLSAVVASWLRGHIAARVKRIVYIVNLDWAVTRGGTSAWVSTVRQFQKKARSRFVVWAKSQHSAHTLANLGINAEDISWTTCDRVRHVRREKKHEKHEPIVFLANVGMGGWQSRRCCDVILIAWQKICQQNQDAVLVLKSIKPLRELVSEERLTALPRIRRIEGYQPRSMIDELYSQADTYIHMSRWEGFGLPLAEALHAGLPCIVSDVPPLNEMVIDLQARMTVQDHRIDGMVVRSHRRKPMRLATRVEPNPEHLAECILRLARDRTLLRWLTCPEPGILEAKQHAFRLRGRASLLGEPEPTIIVLTGNKRCESKHRLSEQYWVDALKLHGYRASLTPASMAESGAGSAPNHIDAIWAGKIPIEILRQVGAVHSAPIFLWHHDLVNHTQQRARWWSMVLMEVDAAAISEGSLDRYGRSKATLRTVFPGAKVESKERPPGRRPLPEFGNSEAVAHFPGVIFLGGCTTVAEKRVHLLRRLSDTGIPVRIHGPDRGWRGAGLESEGPIYGSLATQAYRSAGVSLSISRANTTLHYTSNRLFNIAACGGLPVVEYFEGIDRLFSQVPRFRSMDEAVEVCRDLLGNRDKAIQLRITTQEHVFRAHTWTHRIHEVLTWLNGLDAAGNITIRHATAQRRTATDPEGVRQALAWEKRAQRLGPRNVGHIRWSESQYRNHSELWWQRLERLLAEWVTPEDRILLDFGCGVGRFSQRLGRRFGCTIVGVDVSPSNLSVAKEACEGLDFKDILLPAGVVSRLPLDDASIDILWTCTVLQHIPDSMFFHTILGLRRAIRPGGLVVLIENTDSGTERRESGSGHVVFRSPAEYRACFPGIDVVEQWHVEGQTHSVMVGRVGAMSGLETAAVRQSRNTKIPSRLARLTTKQAVTNSCGIPETHPGTIASIRSERDFLKPMRNRQVGRSSSPVLCGEANHGGPGNGIVSISLEEFRNMIPHPVDVGRFKEVWTRRKDMEVLLPLARSRPDHAHLIEIGTALGDFTAILAAVVSPGSKISTLGLTKDMEYRGLPAQKRELPSRCDLGRHVDRYGAGHKVIIIAANSAEYDWSLLPEAHFIYIDGDHTFAGVKADTQNAIRKLVVGGIIAWHDANRGSATGVDQLLDWLDWPGTIYKVDETWVAFYEKPYNFPPS